MGDELGKESIFASVISWPIYRRDHKADVGCMDADHAREAIGRCGDIRDVKNIVIP